MLLVILALAFASVFLLFLAVAKPKQKEDVEQRLKRLKADEEPQKLKGLRPEPPAEEAPKKKDGLADANAQLDELFLPVAKQRLADAEAEALTIVIANAGRYTMTPLQLRVWQYKAAVIAPFAAGLFLIVLGVPMFVTGMLLVGAAVGGYYFPIIQLNQEAGKRRNAILRQLPTNRAGGGR